MKYLIYILLLVSLGLSSSLAKANTLDLELARKLIVEGKSADAYTLLEPYEFEKAGNPKFDYLLGLAALNSGQPDKATLILERVLAADPLHAAARVDLGRAYYLLGDAEHARAEFTRALELNPPPAAVATIRQHLREIETSSSKPSTQLSGYFEVGTGYNNNVNNSTSQNLVTVPILLNTQILLNSTNVKTADGYLGLAMGGEAIRPVSADWSLYAGVDIHSRTDLKYDNYDFIALDGRAGAVYNKNAEQIKGGLVTGQFDLGGTVNHKSKGFNLEWKHTYDGANQSGLFGQYILYRFPDPALSSNDFNQTIVGFSWLHAFADGRSSIYLSPYGGTERNATLRIDGNKNILGVRLSGQSSISDKLDIFASGGVQWGKYDRTNNSFLVVRDDLQSDLTVGLYYRYAPDWILRPQISLIRNQSNIIIDEYDQADLSLTLRREFK